MLLLLLALTPALLLLIWYYWRDRDPEPWTWVLVVFFAGAVSCAAAHPLERFAQALLPRAERPGWQLLLECLLVPGLIEESVKFVVVAALVLWRKDFDDPVDGLIYSTAAALGFTYGEDLTYYLREGADWSRVLSTAAHPWFSCFWGAALGWTKTVSRWRGVVLVIAGLGTSITVHAIFDFLIFASDMEQGWHWLHYLLTPLLIGLCFAMEWKLERMQRERRLDGARKCEQGP